MSLKLLTHGASVVYTHYQRHRHEDRRTKTTHRSTDSGLSKRNAVSLSVHHRAIAVHRPYPCRVVQAIDGDASAAVMHQSPYTICVGLPDPYVGYMASTSVADLSPQVLSDGPLRAEA